MDTFKPWMIVRRIGETVLLLLFLAMVASAVAQVVTRYVFNAPLTWSEELSRYLFIWLSFLGVWYAWVRREHMGIDLVPDLLSPAARRILLVVLDLLVLIFVLASMFFGQRILQVSWGQPSAVLRLPMVWVYASYYVGMSLVAAEILLGWLYRWRHPTREIAS